MRIMHECNEDVLIGMNSSYCRESQKHPEPVYRGSLIIIKCLVWYSFLHSAYTLSRVAKLARYLQENIPNPKIQKISKHCEYIGDFLLITTQFLFAGIIQSKGV